MSVGRSIRSIVRDHLPEGARVRLKRAYEEFQLQRYRVRDDLDHRASLRVLQAVIRNTDNAHSVRWLGRQIWQQPLDAWLIQEMVSMLRPDLIVETGTYMGGSAFFFATLCEMLEQGEVISIDIGAKDTIPHPRITYIEASSTDPGAVSEVAERIRRIGAKQVLVVLDSDHSPGHVLGELEAYAPFVPVGGYVHVQDGAIDELPVFGKEPGPAAAAKAFLSRHPEFVRDLSVERRFVMTAHPYGWLRRVGE
jgi:cephalosporin hydroxylase